jgi:hypothetical protein
VCRFSDAGNDKARHTLVRPASEKRQGTKSQGSQILVLDAPGARWQVDHDFDERLPRCGRTLKNSRN